MWYYTILRKLKAKILRGTVIDGYLHSDQFRVQLDDDTITESLQLMWVKFIVQEPTKKDDLTNWLTYTCTVSFSQKGVQLCPYTAKKDWLF